MADPLPNFANIEIPFPMLDICLDKVPCRLPMAAEMDGNAPGVCCPGDKCCSIYVPATLDGHKDRVYADIEIGTKNGG